MIRSPAQRTSSGLSTEDKPSRGIEDGASQAVDTGEMWASYNGRRMLDLHPVRSIYTPLMLP